MLWYSGTNAGKFGDLTRQNPDLDACSDSHKNAILYRDIQFIIYRNKRHEPFLTIEPLQKTRWSKT